MLYLNGHFALMLGGAIGNFIDRVLRQEVVDFIHTFPFGYNFPIFNIADSSLVVGVGLLIIHMFLEEKKAKKKEKVNAESGTHQFLNHESSERIDKVISNLNSDWSRTQAQQWIKSGHVLVNGQQIKTNYKCNLNDLIEITIPEPEILDVLPRRNEFGYLL